VSEHGGGRWGGVRGRGDFLRIPKDSYGFLRIPKDSYGFLRN
jgi:hypothetical protein